MTFFTRTRVFGQQPAKAVLARQAVIMLIFLEGSVLLYSGSPLIFGGTLGFEKSSLEIRPGPARQSPLLYTVTTLYIYIYIVNTVARLGPVVGRDAALCTGDAGPALSVTCSGDE